MAKTIDTNSIRLIGTIDSELTLSHTVKGEKMMSAFLRCARTSGTEDILPVQISERIMTEDIQQGDRVKIDGEIRTYNKREEGAERPSLKVFVFVQEIEKTDVSYDVNDVHMTGSLVKKNKARETPLGRKITDTIFAVNRAYNRSSYIPCIYWGKNADYVDRQLPIGTTLEQHGRLQSREYRKFGQTPEEEPHIAYECSITSLKKYEEDKNEDDTSNGSTDDPGNGTNEKDVRHTECDGTGDA